MHFSTASPLLLTLEKGSNISDDSILKSSGEISMECLFSLSKNCTDQTKVHEMISCSIKSKFLLRLNKDSILTSPLLFKLLSSLILLPFSKVKSNALAVEKGNNSPYLRHHNAPPTTGSELIGSNILAELWCTITMVLLSIEPNGLETCFNMF